MFQKGFSQNHKQTVQEAIELTIDSMNAYGPRYDHWAIALSGGKDSSCVATLIPQLIKNGNIAAPKSLTVLYADTRMELPPLQNSALALMDKLSEQGVKCRVVLPPIEERFMVYMLGRGVPPPSNTFRWCTSQIKIEPMVQALRGLREDAGQKLLMLTGVRIGESAVRDDRISVSCSRDNAECGQGWFQISTPESVADTLAPIIHWRVCRVWQWLRQYAPMAGWPTEQVADAYGGNEAEEVNCRTGCVGCNLASKDTALMEVVKSAEWNYLDPLFRLREIYAELKKPWRRLRKHKAEYRKDGKLVANPNRMGPLTMDARRWGMDQIEKVQKEVNEAGLKRGHMPFSLINDEERTTIFDMIENNVWPNGWTGDELRADKEYTELNRLGEEQLKLFHQPSDFEIVETAFETSEGEA